MASQKNKQSPQQNKQIAERNESPPKTKHNIRITVINAQFHKEDAKSKIDSFIKVKYVTTDGKTVIHEEKTKVNMDSGQNPQWDQQFDIYLKDLHQDLIFELHEWDKHEKNFSNDLLGTGKISMQTALCYEGKPFGLEVVNKSKTIGQLSLRVEKTTMEQREQSQHDQMLQDAQVLKFTKYIQETGIERAFKLIFAEILTKKIDRNEVYIYSAVRLRQIGGDLKPLLNKAYNQNNYSQILNNISEVKDETQDGINSDNLIP